MRSKGNNCVHLNWTSGPYRDCRDFAGDAASGFKPGETGRCWFCRLAPAQRSVDGVRLRRTFQTHWHGASGPWNTNI